MNHNGTAGNVPQVAVLEDIKKAYFKPDGSILVEALKSVSLSIPQGQYIAIMGASGSGKSTLMNLLGCLDRPTSGKYILNGRNVAEMTDTELSHTRGTAIGFVFQAFNLINELTVLENVEVPLFYQGESQHTSKVRAVERLTEVGLQDRLTHRPSELSGGQQQRVAIARALVTNPSVIMADEPTGNLDSTTGHTILDLFDKLHQNGMTIIMITHDESVAKRCQRVIRLLDGLVESDSLV